MESVLSERIAQLITRLEPERDADSVLEQLLENELIRRLNRYQLTDRMLSRKYEMSFPEFKARHIVEERGFSYEVESDFWDWEMALDGIETVETMLAELRGNGLADR
jgi:hypothetical protein